MRIAGMFLVCTMVGIIFAKSGIALAADPPAVAAENGGKASELPRLVEVRHLPRQTTVAHLSNGLTVIVQENHAAAVATVRCYVAKTGSIYEGKWMGAGLSHVLEHVVSGGTTTKHSEDEIREIISTFGGATNASTMNNMTTFYVDSPARNVATAMELVADSMQHITFEPKEFERELKVVRRELADDEVERGHVMYDLLNATVYQVHPLRHPVIGYLQVLNKTTNQTIIDFYHQRYVPNNQIFVVVGDVHTAEILDLTAKLWKGTARGYDIDVGLPDEPEQLAPREAVREMDGSSYDTVSAWPTVRLANEDMFALDVAAFILTEGDSSRLVRQLKYDRPLVLSVDAMSYTPEFVRGWFGVFASSQREHWREAMAAIEREVYRLRDDLVNPQELEKAKSQKAAQRVMSIQTVQQTADDLGESYLSTGDPLFEDRYVAGIRRVTAEQVRAAARKYFVPARLNRVIIAPPGGVPKAETAAQREAEGATRLERLPNGLRVLLKRQGNLPLVNIQAFVLAGSLADTPETAGRSRLVADMLDQGTAQRSAEQIAQYFDSVGGQLSFDAGRNTVYGSATVLSKDFPAAAALFAQCFTSPSFPRERFQRMQQLMMGAIAQRADDPQQEIAELFYDNLPAGSPYHILEGGKAETVKALTIEELQAYQRKYFVPNNMIVAVYGDIAAEAALKIVAETFGGLKSDPQFQPPAFQRDNRIEHTLVRHKRTSKDTGMIMLGYSAPSIFQRQEEAAMTVVQAFLWGYEQPSGWLHTELRGAGLVYSVEALSVTGPAPGFFVVLTQTDPRHIDEVLQRIEKNLDRVKNQGFSREEFRTAVRMIIAMHAQDDTTIAQQARRDALDELYGLGYDYHRKFDAQMEAVTPDEVAAVARKYFTQHILVTSSPEARP